MSQSLENPKNLNSENEKKVLCLQTFEVMQYFEHYDTEDLHEIENRISDLSQLKTYCLHKHDRDILPSGQPKPPHFHAVVTLKNVMTVDSLAKALHVESQYINKIKTTTAKAQQYLVHLNDPEKFRYDEHEVIANFDYVKMIEKASRSNDEKFSRENVAEDIASGKIKMYNLMEHISVNEYARNKRYYNNCFEYRQKLIRSLDRNMKTLFIFGESGTGKTTYAKQYALDAGYHCYISSGGKNPLDDYEGQECIILDDARSDEWTVSDFLKLTDNHTDSLVHCRFYNKSIAECKLLIVTSVKDIDKFFESLQNNENEPVKQLLRRFPVKIKVSKSDLDYYGFNEKAGRYYYVMTTQNPVELMYSPERAKAFIDSIIGTMGLKIKKESTENARQMSVYDDDSENPFA